MATIILFSDSLHALIPAVSVTGWKLLAVPMLAPLNFLPLRVLSFSSALGVLACFGSKLLRPLHMLG